MYKRFRTKSARIELSNRHLIHHRRQGFIWAEKLIEGDEILVISSKYGNQTAYEEILEIDEIEKDGLIAPLTEQGTILVNNVYTSCYALVRSHLIGHVALTPYRWYHRLFGHKSNVNITPILNYASVLLNVVKNLPIIKDFVF